MVRLIPQSYATLCSLLILLLSEYLQSKNLAPTFPIMSLEKHFSLFYSKIHSIPPLNAILHQGHTGVTIKMLSTHKNSENGIWTAATFNFSNSFFFFKRFTFLSTYPQKTGIARILYILDLKNVSVPREKRTWTAECSSSIWVTVSSPKRTADSIMIVDRKGDDFRGFNVLRKVPSLPSYMWKNSSHNLYL